MFAIQPLLSKFVNGSARHFWLEAALQKCRKVSVSGSHGCRLSTKRPNQRALAEKVRSPSLLHHFIPFKISVCRWRDTGM